MSVASRVTWTVAGAGPAGRVTLTSAWSPATRSARVERTLMVGPPEAETVLGAAAAAVAASRVATVATAAMRGRGCMRTRGVPGTGEPFLLAQRRVGILRRGAGVGQPLSGADCSTEPTR